jgi:hypothetical protein
MLAGIVLSAAERGALRDGQQREETMNSLRQSLWAHVFGSAGATKHEGILLGIIFLACVVLAVILWVNAAYGFSEAFSDAPLLTSVGEQAVALGSMLVTIVGIFSIYIKRLSM